MSIFARRREHSVEQVRKTVEAGVVAERAASLVAELQEAVIDLRETLRDGHDDES